MYCRECAHDEKAYREVKAKSVEASECRCLLKRHQKLKNI